MIAASRRLLDGPPDAIVAFGREGLRSRAELQADVASLAVRLEPAAGGRLLLHCEDAYAFAVGLLAAAQVGALAVLPPSRQPGALRRLAAGCDGLLLDGAEGAEPPAGRPCWHPLEGPRRERPLVPLDREAPFVELFTSGTTGDGRGVTKALRHVDDEVAVLEQCFGDALGAGTRVLATVSPQHLYGLLFRVLWPLTSGRPFLRSPVLHGEELAPHLAERDPFALVSTPVSLRHLVDRGLLARIGGGGSHPERVPCRAVFSSGGPLPAALARRVAAAVGAPPHEVYGSTESGGVAARQQGRGGEPWQPLPGVAVAPDPATGCAVVTSPFVSTGERLADGRGRCTLGDRLERAGSGGFRLLGRTDRVVKIGDKRLSLPEMEERLAEHPAVAEAALLALGAPGETRVAAVVAPTAAGRELTAAGGRRALAKALGEHLAPDYDRVLLPRAWRVVEALPRDAQGKLPHGALLELFADAPPRPRAFETLAERRGERELELELQVPEELAFLEGHYPGFPIVAGVVQVHVTMRALEAWRGTPLRLEALEALKFQALLRPGDAVHLELRLDEDGRGFAFRLSAPAAPERVFSSGRGRLAARTDAP